MTTAGRERELLPCPFCGGTNILQYGTREGDELVHYEQCADCTSCGPDHKNGRHWNARAPSAPGPELNDYVRQVYANGFAELDGEIAVKACNALQAEIDQLRLLHLGSAEVAAAARDETPEPTDAQIESTVRFGVHGIPDDRRFGLTDFDRSIARCFYAVGYEHAVAHLPALPPSAGQSKLEEPKGAHGPAAADQTSQGRPVSSVRGTAPADVGSQEGVTARRDGQPHEVAAAIERLDTFATGGHLYFGILSDVRLVCTAASRAVGPPREQWQHVKTGRVYTIIAHEARAEWEYKLLGVVYRGEDGQTWFRPYGEFHDGRFVRYDAAEAAPGAEKP